MINWSCMSAVPNFYNLVAWQGRKGESPRTSGGLVCAYTYQPAACATQVMNMGASTLLAQVEPCTCMRTGLPPTWPGSKQATAY